MTDPAATSPAPAADAPTPVVCAHLGWAMLEVSGTDAPKFLQGQLSSDVEALPPGRGQYWSYNSPKGRMLANGALWRTDDDTPRIRMLLASDLAAPIAKRLSMFVLRAKVAVADASSGHALLGVGGGGSAEAAHGALGIRVSPFAIAPFGADAQALGLPDGRIVVACAPASAPIIHAALARHATTGNADEWRWLGIAAGVPWITAATSDLFVPQAANWDVLGGVNFQKGCYTGQEIIARTQYLGRLKERLHAFHTDADSVQPAARLYSAAFGDDQPCGTVVDAAPGPARGIDLLAVVQQNAVDANDIRLGQPDGIALERKPLPYPVPQAGAARKPAL